MKHIFRISLLSAIMLLIVVSSAQAENPNSTATVGLRAGSNTIEGFVDVIVPYSISDNALVFVNPRFLLGDAGVDQINVGVGARYLFDEVGVIGANLYYDKRQSPLGFDFEQLGFGLEWLGNLIDARVNVYQAEDSLQLANSFNTLETQTLVDVTQSRSGRNFSSSSISTNVSFSNFSPGAPISITGNALVQTSDATQTTTSTTTTTNIREVTTATTTTTTTIQTGRLFEQYQGALDGWDAELGIKLPLNIKPEVRIFGGWYDFDDPFRNNHQLEGYKARAEVRAGRYFTFDAEVYEEARNGSDYFVGFRLEIPFNGKDTFKHFKDYLWAHPGRALRERMNSEMVMRDVQIHTDISKPIENVAKRKQEVNKNKTVSVSVSQSSTTSTSSSSSSKRVTNKEFELKSDITFVDADNTGAGSGTKEDPYKTVIEATNNASENNTIFVCENGGGVCDLAGGGGTYDETANGGSGVTLQDGQTLTSSFTGTDLGGAAYTLETTNKPKIQNTSQGISIGVINTSGNNTVNRLDITTQNVSTAFGIYNNSHSGTVNVTNNDIAVPSNNGAGVYNYRTNGAVKVSGNTITTTDSNGVGVFNASTNGVVTISNNTVTATSGNGDGVYNTDNNGEIIISNNTLNSGGAGIINLFTKEKITIDANIISTDGIGGIFNVLGTGVISASGNTITTTGPAHALYLTSRGECNHFTGNTLDAQGTGNDIEAPAFSINQFSQSSIAALEADNTLVNGTSSFSGSETFNCTP